ncbi:MAG: hypothetical protein ACTSQE_12410 [Candidatus Heimdallarchaeaceae archaeon]
MKSEFGDRETLGTQILKTKEEHESSSPIEAGELAHEGGKSYMRELIDTVENHRHITYPYYIQVISSRDVFFGDRVFHFRFFARQSEPLIEDDMDLWYVDNKTDQLKLMWSLPHWSEFDMILADEKYSDKKLIDWIIAYKRMQNYSP